MIDHGLILDELVIEDSFEEKEVSQEIVELFLDLSSNLSKIIARAALE
jgi:hypothetical protein